ncbi:MAG: hypothetical protein N3E37_01335 [Candidatus Micrarchaeota archaeon]|nr:hypothetical protein [Candidatus Micrarchaeota archaeon]
MTKQKNFKILLLFNINTDILYELAESSLKSLFFSLAKTNKISDSGNQFKTILDKGVQGEILLDKDSYDCILKQTQNLKPRILLGGNIGNMLSVLLQSKRIQSHVFVPWSDKIAFTTLRRMGKLNIYFNNMRIHNSHLIFQTELRRIILTPVFDLNNLFVSKRDIFLIQKLLKNEYDLLIVSGAHLLDENAIIRMSDIIKKAKAKFKFCELAHFSSSELLKEFIESSYHYIDLYGMSLEEYNHLKQIYSDLDNRIRYFVHSRSKLYTNCSSLFKYLKIADSYCKKVYALEKIQVGLGDRFSGVVIKELFNL